MKIVKRTVMGGEIELPEFAKCNWCGKEKARLHGVIRVQPCDDCKNTKRYDDYLKRKTEEDNNFGGIDSAFANQRPAGVWEGQGRQVVTNSRGDIIKDVPYKPRKAGVADEALKI